MSQGMESESGTADLPEETIEEIERERAERLDPDNRPEDTEVDNTERTFDSGAGKFTDSDDYDDERPAVRHRGARGAS